MINQTYYRIKSQDLALFKFILEGYDGLATVTTTIAKTNRHTAEIMITTSQDFATDLEEIIDAVKKEFSLDDLRSLDNGLFCSKEA